MMKRQRASRARRVRGAPLKASSGRRNGGKRKGLPSTDVYGIRVPERLFEAIEMEREALSKADSLLACMVIAMEYESDSVTGPYYPAVAQTAREFLERSINRLDSVNLKQRLLDRIEDEFYGPLVDQDFPLVRYATKAEAMGVCFRV